MPMSNFTEISFAELHLFTLILVAIMSIRCWVLFSNERSLSKQYVGSKPTLRISHFYLTALKRAAKMWSENILRGQEARNKLFIFSRGAGGQIDADRNKWISHKLWRLFETSMNGKMMTDDPKMNRNSKYIADTFILHLFFFKTILFIGIRLCQSSEPPILFRRFPMKSKTESVLSTSK